MASLNKIMLIGNLGADPDVSFLNNGEAVANFRVATSVRWKDRQSGELREETEWHRVSCFGRQAEYVGQYLKKGNRVYVEGRLRTRKWTDKEGIERYTTEILAQSVQGMGSVAGAAPGQAGGGDARASGFSGGQRGGNGNGYGNNGGARNNANRGNGNAAGYGAEPPAFNPGFDPNDVPF